MENQAKKQEYAKTTVTIPNVRFVFVKIFKPEKKADGTEVYSVCILIDKEDKEVKATLEKALTAARDWGIRTCWNGQAPANLRIPLKDGDAPDKASKEYGATYAGKLYIDASSRRPVKKIYNTKREQITDPAEFRSGDYGVVVVTFKPYYKNGNAGIGAYLEGILKTKDSDGAVNVESELDAYFDKGTAGGAMDFLGL